MVTHGKSMSIISKVEDRVAIIEEKDAAITS
jgi:hypothetical protein